MRMIVCSLIGVSFCLPGQTPAVPAIEVATIRPTAWTSENQAIFERLRTTQKGCPRIVPQISGNRLTWTFASICALVRSAYDIEPYQMVDGPKWFRANTDPSIYFDMQVLVHVPEGTVVTREQSKFILRALLADRFRLTLHQAMRELPVYEMRADKGGPKVLSTDLAKCDRNRPGKFLQSCKPTFTMAGFANTLSSYLDRPVIDRTGFVEKFAFLLVWNEPDAGQDLDSAPELFSALRDQLGLKLTSARADVPVFVIDTVERPSEN